MSLLPPFSPHFRLELVAASVLFFATVYVVGKLLLPLSRSYRGWSKSEQYHARGIAASSLFILLIVPMSVWAILYDDELKETRVVGSTRFSRLVIHAAAGYFMYDSAVVLLHLHLDGVQYLVHGVLCLITYGLAALFDRYNYYGPVFLIFETTTIFINLRWCLVHLGLKDRPVYLYNGLALMVAWFVVRILFGLTMSAFFWRDTINNSSDIPKPIMLWYTFSNFCLNGLNIFWFSKILKGVLSHVSGKKLSKDE
mmetsp:Transcript_16156/g.39358  ORF Transcript_16156/g.39358 Transcript_16156/m.39358 type:complete len:254 (-) Transcript_16156:403-1164(-)